MVTGRWGIDCEQLDCVRTIVSRRERVPNSMQFMHPLVVEEDPTVGNFLVGNVVVEPFDSFPSLVPGNANGFSVAVPVTDQEPDTVCSAYVEPTDPVTTGT